MTETQERTIEDVQRELDEFKKKVRQTASQVRLNQGWCLEGANSVLRDLGLEPLTEYVSYFRVTGKYGSRKFNEALKIQRQADSVEEFEADLSDESAILREGGYGGNHYSEMKTERIDLSKFEVDDPCSLMDCESCWRPIESTGAPVFVRKVRE